MACALPAIVSISATIKQTAMARELRRVFTSVFLSRLLISFHRVRVKGFLLRSPNASILVTTGCNLPPLPDAPNQEDHQVLLVDALDGASDRP